MSDNLKTVASIVGELSIKHSISAVTSGEWSVRLIVRTVSASEVGMTPVAAKNAGYEPLGYVLAAKDADLDIACGSILTQFDDLLKKFGRFIRQPVMILSTTVAVAEPRVRRPPAEAAAVASTRQRERPAPPPVPIHPATGRNRTRERAPAPAPVAEPPRTRTRTRA